MFGVILGGLFTLCVAYVLYTLLSSSGSEFADNSIDAFIIETDNTSKKSKTPKVDPYRKKYDTEGRQILILYGTEYGFSEEIAKKLFDRIESDVCKEEEFPWHPRVVDVKHYEHLNFSKESIVFIVISTAGDGIPPTEARPFCSWLEGYQGDCHHLSYSVLALGDSNYPHFCKTGKNVDKWLQILGGRCVAPRHDVDMEDWEVINRWLDTVVSSLDTADVQPSLDYLDIPESEGSDAGPSRSRPFSATMTVKRSLTRPFGADDKETIHCEFDLRHSEVTWTSGDALGIYPQNDPTEVSALLGVVTSQGSEVTEVPKWAYEPKPDDGSLDLQTALMKYYDLKTVRPELLQLLQNKATGTEADEIENLLKNGMSKKNTFLQEYLHEREVADVLKDFSESSSRVTISEVLGLMKGLQPRYYSIASSPCITTDSCTVTAAIVRYTTLGLPRTGVTTTYLQDRLNIGETCPVFISHNPEFRLPCDGSLPIIMVGPGTGIAPFMAFISERIASSATGTNLLYFGCRRQNQDFLYKEELESWATEGHLKLRTAFSRDQQNKIYVQDRIREDSSEIHDLITNQNAHVYICGDAKHMAHDVHRELMAILQREGDGLTEQQAEGVLRELETSGRYQKDVWVT